MNPSPSLPQHDAANAEDRKQLLYAARQQYQYDHDYLSPLAMLFVPHAWPPSLLIPLSATSSRWGFGDRNGI